jgi:MFS family permease
VVIPSTHLLSRVQRNHLVETSARRRRRIRRGPRPLQHPLFRRVFAVAVAGHLVRFIDFTIVAWLVVQLTDSSSAVGLLIFFRVIPFLILGPVVGTLLDRFPRIEIFRLTQLGLAVSAAVFGAAVFLDLASLPVIYAYTLIMGILFMAEIPSKRAYMSGIVGPAALGSALALDMVSLNLSWFAGSNLAGLVANLINPGWAYMVIGGVFFANFLVLRKLPVMFRRSAEENAIGPLRSLVEGFRYARGNQAIFAGLLVVGINNFFGYPFESMAAAFASDIYDAGPTQFGLLMSAQGLGATITAGYIAVMGRRLRNPGKYLIVAAMIQAIGNIGFSYTTTVTTGFLAIMTLGLVQMVFGITHTMLILLAAPSNLRGRIMGFQVLMMGLFPVGSLALGITGDAIGLSSAVRVFSITGFILLSIVWIFYPKLRRPIV